MMLACVALSGGPAVAQVTVKPLIDARIRYEQVDQADLPRGSDALTARFRAGAEATRGPWSALVEGEGTLAIVDRYNDGLNGRAHRPLIADPESLELNRAQLRYIGSGGSATFGRQRIDLLDQRFVGSAPFRQNEQTFDAARVRWAAPTGLSADVSYAWSVRTVNGSRGRGARQRAVDGDNIFAVLGHPTPIGVVNAFAFLVDQDEAAVQGFRLASQTYGVRLAGSHDVTPGWKLSYVGSIARQSDLNRNPNNYAASYYLVEATIAHRALAATIGHERLGADRGAPLTSFQTPLASLFKFQGWADRYTTTPPDGVRDLYASLGHGWKAVGPAEAINVTAAVHRFDSDRRHYGDEVDLLATARIGRSTLAARYAHYRADRFASDGDKLWLSVDWNL